MNIGSYNDKQHCNKFIKYLTSLVTLTRDDLNLIAEVYEATIEFDYDEDDKTNGAWVAIPDRCIMIRACDEPWIEEMCFWHELGHILMTEIGPKTHTLSTLSAEGTAWEVGLSIASKWGRQWEYHSKQLDWAREQLKSYIGGEYDELSR